MRLTKNHFEDYPENCSDVKSALSWLENLENQDFTMEELERALNHRWKERAFSYLKREYHEQYLNEVLGKNASSMYKELDEKISRLNYKINQFGNLENLEDLLYNNLKLENEYKSKQNALDREIAKYSGTNNLEELIEKNQDLLNGWNYKEGTVQQVLNFVFKTAKKILSYDRYNSLMSDQLQLLLRTSFFRKEDYSEISKKSYVRPENDYAVAIKAGNASAIKSIEIYLKRKPFIINRFRMFEGRMFLVIIDGKKANFRCTGWNDSGRIKFIKTVYPSEKKQLLNFDNKEFKDFFKNLEIDVRI